RSISRPSWGPTWMSWIAMPAGCAARGRSCSPISRRTRESTILRRSSSGRVVCRRDSEEGSIKMRGTICLTALLIAAASPALAHPGHEASGFLHPLTGVDHLLAMVGVGMWAAFLAVRKPAMAALLPAAFLAMMAIGAAAGFAGIKVPLVEAAILGSV